ncbi:MAG TPA: Imm52 family immunity protein [Caulobacteraceae bacterium]|nr:Imm52 family immunity protein [Caulobacteraceae bacterium]
MTLVYRIASAWPSKPEAPEIIGRKFIQTLELFERVDPLLAGWWTTTHNSHTYEHGPPLTVASLKSDPADWLEGSRERDDWGDVDPSEGYTLGGLNGFPPGSLPKERQFLFIVSAGSRWVGKSSFELKPRVSLPEPTAITYAMFKGVLMAMISVWPAPWANAKCSIWGEDPPTLPGEPPFPYSGYQMPWISYLSAERAAPLGPLPDLVTERTPDGGLLMSATSDKFDPTNVEHMRRSRRMAEIMIEHAGNPGW